MKLKRLVLQGYKTFATKTEFVFDEGITAIVGPNGSGKSNIADALRWVLGEQSYSTLRGKRTTDMIFAGSERRPRAGMAQAILTLDNSDGWLPIDYTEVEIGRRAYRSGENEYLLNGQKVRLKDITDLLATSGLAERTYTVIGQGLIDQALSLRSEERRALFEEAAGINHYKARRAETLRRLQETQQNIQRVHDILSEIRPRLTSLRRQATRAQNYEQIATDLRHLLRIWYGYKWEQAKRNLREAREVAETAESNWQQRRNRLLVHQQNADDLRDHINRLQEQTADFQSQRDDVRDKLEKARRDVAILKERQEANKRLLAEFDQDLPTLEQQRQEAETELLEATGELNAAQANLKENQAELRQFNATFEAKQEAINHWQQKLKTAETEQRRLQNKLAQAEGQLSQLRERLQEHRAEANNKATNAEERQHIEKEIEQKTAALDSALSYVDELQREHQALRDRQRDLINDLKKQRRVGKEQARQLNEQRDALARLETRVDMLDHMRNKEVKIDKNVRVMGQLANFLTIPGEYRTALETALAHRLATLVLPETADLWQLVNDSKDNRQSLTAAVLADVKQLPRPETPDDPNVIGWAADLVTADDKAQPVVARLLGTILLVQDVRTAYRLALSLPPGALAVTPAGFVVHAGGLVETGDGAAQNSMLASEEAWRDAKDELRRMKDELDRAEEEAAVHQSVIDEKQATVDELQNEEQRLGQLEQEANQRVSQAQRQIDRAQQQRDFLLQQQAQREREIQRLRKRVEEMEQSIATHREQMAAVETAVVEANATLDDLPIAEAQQQRQTLRQAIGAAQTIVAGRKAVVDSRQATLNQIEKQIGRLQERKQSLQRQQQQIATADEEQVRRRFQEQVELLDARLKPMRERLVEYRRELTALEREMRTIQRQTHDLETKYTQAQVRFTQQENQLEGLQERIKADLGLVALAYDDDQTGPTPLPIGDFVEQLPTIDELPDDIEETIHNYRGQMQRMGAINPDAPAEYEETQARHDFLTQQIDDLNETEAKLREVIAELDDLTSRAFGKTVEEVNEVFGETFEQLFGGGSAQLVLTDPDDLTVSGVDIIARLPNQRPQPLGLLSGGERSLTAAALIFSLLKVSPTPFCVMDEVDAALDEANINRFRQQLRDLSMKIQFVIVTHNRGTVQAAQTLYGISMGSDSTSQAISIKPEAYLKEKAGLV